jgi:serine/threonine-protein kinase
VATSRIAQHVGRVLGDRYRLIRPVGTGASAHVYVAEDVILGRRVAVKLLHPALADDEAFLRRFRAEARVVAALRHANIVRVYDWGEDAGAPYLVMELLEGGSLRSLLDAGHRFTPAQAALLGAEVARGLDYAHRRGLVHRDIKPANLLFDEEGRVCIADFGVARALAEATWTEPAGAVLGTARYAAPEQVRGASLDGKADIYALALVLVEALTGAVPFAADTTIATLMGRIDQPLPVDDSLGPLAPVLRAAGSPEAADRPAAGELVRAFTEAGAGFPPPGPLPLGNDLHADELDAGGDVTDLAGRPVLFDGEQFAPSPPDSAYPPPVSVAASRPLGDLPPEAAASPDWGRRRRRRDGGQSGRRRRWPWVVLVVVVLAAVAAGAVALLDSGLTKATHPVPNLAGQSATGARSALTPLHLHLRIGRPVFDEQVAKGLISRQQPAPSTRLREGSTVSVQVSAGPPPVTVPDLSGLTADQAKQRLIGAGFAAGSVVTRSDDTVPAGVVISWTGQGGQLTKGSPVDLVVSTGKPMVTVPDVHAETFTQARTALAGVGLSAVEADQFNDAPAGQVVSTDPANPTVVIVGTQVTVTVSKGPDLVTVPSVVGQGVLSATSLLDARGLNVNAVVGSPSNPVTMTSPPAGARVKRGSAVRLYTS